MNFLELPEVNKNGFNKKAELPYGLSIDDVSSTIKNVHHFMNRLDTFLLNDKLPPIEDYLLRNAFAGLLSEIIVKSMADSSSSLVRNKRVGGYPDLIPSSKYENDSILRGIGIEIKASKQQGGWQGHNPETGWIMIFRYFVDTKPNIEDRTPTEIIEVYAAQLVDEDWNFSGRVGASRRTITASINNKGMSKLRTNWVYKKEGQQKIDA